MGARIKRHSRFRGVQIYAAANTHPASETTSLLIFTEDIVTYTGKKAIERFRYKRHDSADHTRAVCEVSRFITTSLLGAYPQT